MSNLLRHVPVARLIPAVGVLALLAGCSRPAPTESRVAEVRLVNPRQHVFGDSATYQSTLEAIREVRLSPEIDGRIVAMPMSEGQPVRRGQLLFQLDQVQQQAATDSARAEALKDRQNAERYIFLNEQGAVSTKERDFYVTQAIQSRDQFSSSRATLGYKNVTAPIDGEVGTIQAKVGDVVRAGGVVTSVIDNSRLWVRLDVAGEDAPRVRRGLPVLLQPLGGSGVGASGTASQGRVTFVAPSLDKERQTLLVKATFENADGSLRNNQRVGATLVFDRKPLLAIPEQAVLLQAGKTFVFLAVPPAQAIQRLGRPLATDPPPGSLVAIQVPVELGELQNNLFPVLSGLTSADDVIVGRLAQLRSGQVVRATGPRP